MSNLREPGAMWVAAGALLVVTIAAYGAVRAETTSSSGYDRVNPAIDGDDGLEGPRRHRIREGTHLVNQTGRFRPNGESLTFVDDTRHELGVLPNLNLERVQRLMKTVDEPESVSWTVSGLVTEYSGKNYLLISRAVYKAAVSNPGPTRDRE